ncbi:MAG TPA: hypothetical protein VLI07_04130 [Candidatus Binatus sp.]|jgi:hypothetical protein|nr:hypothetical protein [Candidatus Binatus sp.]
MTGAGRWAPVALCALLAGATFAPAQPSPMTAKGCCCVVEGVAWRCTEKTQADCLALQPGAPVFPKVADWKKMWDAYVTASEAQANKPSYGGWVAESCGADINPATGEPRGAPTGCCCMPKLHPSGDDRFDCKSSMTNFDCKAECAFFKDGRLPSGCTWAAGACRQ